MLKKKKKSEKLNGSLPGGANEIGIGFSNFHLLLIMWSFRAIFSLVLTKNKMILIRFGFPNAFTDIKFLGVEIYSKHWNKIPELIKISDFFIQSIKFNTFALTVLIMSEFFQTTKWFFFWRTKMKRNFEQFKGCEIMMKERMKRKEKPILFRLELCKLCRLSFRYSIVFNKRITFICDQGMKRKKHRNSFTENSIEIPKFRMPNPKEMLNTMTT